LPNIGIVEGYMGGWRVDIYAKQFALGDRKILGIAVHRIIAEAEVEHAVGSKAEAATFMDIPGMRNGPKDNIGRCWIYSISVVRVDRVPLNDRRSIGISIAHV
jgi:hypothetical protein